MPEPNAQNVFFIDDDLVERLMRGDSAESPAKTDPTKKRRPAESSALGRAVNLAAAGKLDDAIKELEGAAARGENPVEVYNGLGHLRFEQQNWDAAAECYAKVTATESWNLSAHYNLGLTLERQGKFEEAAKSFETAVQLDPQRWQAQAGRGLCLLHLGSPEAALGCFEAALKDNPTQDRPLFGKAVALHQLGRLDEAGEIYRKLLPSNRTRRSCWPT